MPGEGAQTVMPKEETVPTPSEQVTALSFLFGNGTSAWFHHCFADGRGLNKYQAAILLSDLTF